MADFHYVKFDPEEVWKEMTDTYIDAGGDVLYPGDEKSLLLQAVLAMAIAVMGKVDNALMMDTLTYATRDYLKEYGRKRNCEYIDAIPARATVELTFRATGVTQVIEAGTELTADGIVIYHTVDDILQSGAKQTTTAEIECAMAGSVGNGLIAGTQMQILDSTAAVETAIVIQTATGGVDAEDEEAYRERIRAYGLASSTTGCAAAYEAVTKTVSSQIVDAKALNNGGGEVGVYLILADGANEAAIFQSVEAALSPIDRRPLTDTVTIRKASEVTYALKVEVWYSDYNGLTGDLQETVEAYRTWQDDTIGRAFNPDKLMAMLYQIGCDRVRFAAGSGMGGSVEYAEIAENARCKGTIELIVVNT
ncbi:MAG: baseplate J/gp47 family protein [Clostridia bacterium]|nr:baseplate J/gp47 family protein [Clostridia bacterium]